MEALVEAMMKEQSECRFPYVREAALVGECVAAMYEPSYSAALNPQQVLEKAEKAIRSLRPDVDRTLDLVRVRARIKSLSSFSTKLYQRLYYDEAANQQANERRIAMEMLNAEVADLKAKEAELKKQMHE